MDIHPQDPITQLAAAAVQLHELYGAYIAAGFTDVQAFELVKVTLAASVGGAG
ncbi:hypothetical protein KVH31_13730 [Streptomyces olivaceus]|uniref:hypothetical protein n=1 Tax=Streptomyces olivaceus TaxID=47716 RepID=UPI001CCF36C4|nr:hypothetical protein [Streptomyces olivaceus]MBZ6207560.1 hypothetical protein [Streptomyces olivaceus]